MGDHWWGSIDTVEEPYTVIRPFPEGPDGGPMAEEDDQPVAAHELLKACTWKPYTPIEFALAATPATVFALIGRVPDTISAHIASYMPPTRPLTTLCRWTESAPLCVPSTRRPLHAGRHFPPWCTRRTDTPPAGLA